MQSEFTKHDLNKPQLSLIPTRAKAELARVLKYGVDKYGRNNWEKCDDKLRYIDAALRHIDSYIEGTIFDYESGYHHLAHAIASLMFIVELEKRYNLNDN